MNIQKCAKGFSSFILESNFLVGPLGFKSSNWHPSYKTGGKGNITLSVPYVFQSALPFSHSLCHGYILLL